MIPIYDLRRCEINERYSLTTDSPRIDFMFEVMEKYSDRIRVRYFDNTIGLIYFTDSTIVYKFPYVGLERELL